MYVKYSGFCIFASAKNQNIMFSDQDVDKYLRRIGYSGTISLTGETLSGLQRAHLAAIPYENLDILKGIPLSVDPQIVYKKVIENHRGGFCFELNGIFSELLESIGFKVTNYLSRFLFNRPEDLPIPTHRVLKVECGDGIFIADVGTFVDLPRMALRFVKNVVQSDGFQLYIYDEDSILGHVLYQLDSETGNRKKFYSFMECPFFHEDFAIPSFYTEKHPESRFAKTPMVSIKTEKEYVALYGNKLIKIKNGITTKQNIENEDLENILAEYFHIKSFFHNFASSS